MKEKINKKKEDRKQMIKNLKKAYQYAKYNKKEFFLYFFFNIVLAIIGAIAPLISAQQLLRLTNNLLEELISLSVLVLIIELTRNICHYFSRMFSQRFAREVLKRIQIDMTKEILRMETKDLDKKSSGIFIDRLVKDSTRISDIFLDLNMSITDVITNIGILLAIYVINKWIFLYYIISITLIFILEKIRAKKRNELDKHYRKSAEETTGIAGELIRGVRDIKVLNASKSFLENIEDKINKVNQERYKMSSTTRKYDLVIGSIKDLCDLLLILFAIYLIKIDNLTAPSLLIIYMYRGRIINLLSFFSYMLEFFKDFNLSATRVFEIIDSDEYHKEVFGTKHIDNIKGNIEFKDVYFGYNKNKMVLKGTSFSINKNETIAIVGKSGAGKTTIFSLLAKLYTIDKGDILIDGLSINELDEESIRGNISIITQNPYIFNMTIKQNLTSVKKDLTEEEMIQACKLACLHDYVMTLPDGYDTLIGEGGLTLSGGQKQRLAIARALVQNTKIILFDEATSALDNETQKSIQDAINNMKNKYTILIVAHRLSTVMNANKIFVLENGKITNTGTHEELLKKSKEYQKLYNLELKKES